MITIKEVAELAKVSQATVSRALNGHATVKEANKVKVFAAIEKLGYKPNAFAQALASSRSNSIGMLVGSLGWSFLWSFNALCRKYRSSEKYAPDCNQWAGIKRKRKRLNSLSPIKTG